MSALPKPSFNIGDDAQSADLSTPIGTLSSWLPTYSKFLKELAVDSEIEFSNLTQSKTEISQPEQAEKIFKEADLLSKIVEVSRLESRPETFRVLQSWECVVKAFDIQRIVAVTKDLINRDNPDEEIEVDLETIPEADHDLIQLGAVFYWHVGYLKDAKGTVMRGSVFRFRRLPAWSRKDIENASLKADELRKILVQES